MNQILKNANEKSDYEFFIGDINIDLLVNCENTNNYQSVMNENGFLSTINAPTRIQRILRLVWIIYS